MFLFSFVNPDHERRAARDRPRGVPRRRPHLAVARGHAPGPGVRADVDHAGQRLRRPPDRPLRRQPLATRCASAGYGGPLLIMQSTGGVMPPEYVARRAVTLLGSGPTGGVMGSAVAAGAGGRARLRRRRHGRHQLRHLPGPRRAARGQDRLELALPLLHRAADGRRAERRRRRRLDRPGAPGRAAGRPRERRVDARARPATAGAATGRRSPTPTPCSATCPSTGFAGGRMTLDVDAARAAIERDVAEPLGDGRRSRRPGASSASSTPTWPTPPAGCWPATAPTPGTWP